MTKGCERSEQNSCERGAGRQNSCMNGVPEQAVDSNFHRREKCEGNYEDSSIATFPLCSLLPHRSPDSRALTLFVQLVSRPPLFLQQIPSHLSITHSLSLSLFAFLPPDCGKRKENATCINIAKVSIALVANEKHKNRRKQI